MIPKKLWRLEFSIPESRRIEDRCQVLIIASETIEPAIAKGKEIFPNSILSSIRREGSLDYVL